MRTRPVLIAGLGVAGPTLAYWLGAAGFEPTVVERAPALRRGGYVIDFWGLGYDVAERMGLADKIGNAGWRMRELRIVDDRGEQLAGFGARVFQEVTGGRFVTLGRSDLSLLLFETIEHETEIIFGDEVVGLKEGASGIDVEFKGAGQRRFDLVVGADGLHSSIRRLAFGPQERFEKKLGYVAAAFEARGYRPRDEDVYVLYCAPGRMVARFALHDDRTLFLFVFSEGIETTTEALDLPAQKAILRKQYCDGKWECADILGELDDAREVYFDRVSQIKMDKWSQGRVALVGDAAFCVSLTAGQGSALAMTAAYVLAGELAASGGLYEGAFDRYDAILRAFITRKQRAAERFASAFAPRTRLGLFARNQIVKACNLPGLAKIVFGRDIIDRLPLPAYDFDKSVGRNSAES
jgi:2-polyprenyl-6-methoxyphenol hydroxylase-like FAD-dependent oxidoreductase